MNTKTYREFDCTGCGENSATYDPDLIACDDCRAAYLRKDMPFPDEGDSCEVCEDFGGSLEYDHFEAAEQRMADARYARPVALWGGK
ncbi:MAG: hypothetical protein IT178_16470 [Acidobacteria bacterium]|nr:hypothetical protein [Acidobacteriota bacterium]